MTNEERYTIDTTPHRVKVFEPSPGPSGDRLRKYNALKLNIDRQKTIGDIQYDDSIIVEYLSPGSHEKVWAVCIQCGKYRHVMYQSYCHLCLSCSMIGKHPSEETRQKLSAAQSGENNPNFGKPPSEETRQKMSDAHSGEKNHNFGKHRLQETRKKISCTKQGIVLEQFNGFVNKEHMIFRASTEYTEWRNAVFKRDSYTCQECGAHGGVDLEAHHITSLHIHREPEYSLNTDNGITLCKLCHDKTKGYEDEFYNKYTAIVKAKCGFKGDFLSSSVILEGLREQNDPTQSLLNDEFVIPEKAKHQDKIFNLVKSIVKQCVTYPPEPHSTCQSTLFTL